MLNLHQLTVIKLIFSLLHCQCSMKLILPLFLKVYVESSSTRKLMFPLLHCQCSMKLILPLFLKVYAESSSANKEARSSINPASLLQHQLICILPTLYSSSFPITPSIFSSIYIYSNPI